jgi:hypothetical protein
MSDKKIKVDMSRHQRPYERGPQTRKNLADEFAREFPGEKLASTGEAMYDEMEARLRALYDQRKLAKEKE